MEIAVGTIVEGKVTSITKFGAFVSLPENRTGLVHISEIAHTYVNDIREHLTEGQEVKVKIVSVDDAGRINLSIKKTQELPERQPQRAATPRQSNLPVGPQTFEDKLKAFMSDSETKMSEFKQHTNKRDNKRRK